MSTEAIMAAAYGVALLAGAFLLEWLSAHTHRRALRYRTAGFEYDEAHDHWTCPEGEHLWPHEFDRDRRLVRYRAKAHVCNGCPRKPACTDSDVGREIVRPLDPWPHSEAGRFHRVLALMLVGLAAFIVVVGLIRNHDPAEAGMLFGVLVICGLSAFYLARDLRVHPSNFPEPTAAQGLRMAHASADGTRVPSKWASQKGGRRP
jgi:hypothetical protein